MNVRDAAGFEFDRGRCLCSSSAAPRSFTAAAAWLKRATRGKQFLSLLPQLGHVLRRFIHPRQRRAAQFEETNRDGGHQKPKHDRGGERRRNMALGQPADERFQSHSPHTSQEDRQDDRTGEVKEGNRAQHNQDDLHRCRFRSRGGLRGRGGDSLPSVTLTGASIAPAEESRGSGAVKSSIALAAGSMA